MIEQEAERCREREREEEAGIREREREKSRLLYECNALRPRKSIQWAKQVTSCLFIKNILQRNIACLSCEWR